MPGIKRKEIRIVKNWNERIYSKNDIFLKLEAKMLLHTTEVPFYQTTDGFSKTFNLCLISLNYRIEEFF